LIAWRCPQAAAPNGSLVDAVVLSVVSTLAVRDGYAAGDIATGRQKALMCQTCHGLDGKAKIPEAPSLAG
jgi:cytochrome c553